MKAISVIVAIIGAFAISACADAPVRLDTPSGNPEVSIAGVSKKQVADALVNRLLSKGWTLTTTNDYQLVFRHPLDSIGASLLYGSQYNVNPDARATISLVDAEGGVRVMVTLQAVTNPGSQFEQVSEIRTEKDLNAVQDTLNGLKATLQTPAVAHAAQP